MFRILEKNSLGPQVYRYKIVAPDIAKKAQPGQFVIIRLDETGERFPITISDMDSQAGTLTVYVQAVGKSSIEMSQLKEGEFILDLAGPLGNPSEINIFGTVVLIGGGFGIAAIHPIARALTLAGNKTLSLLGARNRDLVLLEEEMRAVSSEVHVITNDGSAGRQGLVTDMLLEIIQSQEKVDRVIAIGPLVMMKAVSDMTRSYGISTIVSMNPIMIDGTGMCGACRVTVNGEIKFACVDGPEFDAHLVDFEGVLNRMKTYTSEEREAREQFQRESAGSCKLE